MFIVSMVFASPANDYRGRNFYTEVNRGNVKNMSVVHKFGKNFAVDTTLEPLTSSGFYRTPTTLTSLEIVSDSANDTAAGTGARTVIVEGINDVNGSWTSDTETITMNGTTPVALSKQWRRIYRMRVVTSGTYGSQSGSSHSSTITLRESGAGDTWAQIDSIGTLGLGQSLIGAYTIPAGKKAWIKSRELFVEANKTVTTVFFVRTEADTTTAPFSPMRIQNVESGVQGQLTLRGESGIIEGPADIGYMGKVNSGSGAVSVEFDIYLFDN